MTGKKIVLDCDTGVDDAMALAYLLASDVDLLAVTSCFGNISAAQAAQNSLRILELTGRTTIPVALGSEVTLRGDHPELAQHVHGRDGLGNTGLPDPSTPLSNLSAVEMIVSLARAHPGEVHLVATGPLTNVAGALVCEPRLPELIASVTVMGGAALAPGNQSPAAEANILHDAEAAQAVFAAPWDVTLVPLDVTMREILTEDHRTRLAAGNDVARLIAAATDHYFDFFHEVSFDRRCSPCHDALAAAICVGDVVPLFAPRVPVSVDCGEGPARGATICDLRQMYRPMSDDPCGVRVVLETSGTFPDQLVDRILAGWTGVDNA